MAAVEDRWHSRTPNRDNAQRCTEHRSRQGDLYVSAVHGTGKRWAVRWWEGTAQRRRSFARQDDALKFKNKISSDLDRGTYFPPDVGKMALRKVCEEWLESADHRETTSEGARRQLELHVYPFLGDRPVGSLRRYDVEAWRTGRRKVLADSTTAIVYGRLKAVLTFAVHNEYIARNPCDGVKPMRYKGNQVVPLDREAVAALVAAAPRRYRALILLAAGSGLRQGELFGLEARHLDLDAGEVHVRQQVISPDRGAPYLAPPKTDGSARTVPLAKTIVDALRRHLEEFSAAVDIEDRTEPRKPHTRTALLVFPNGDGGAVRRGAWAKVWAATLRRAGAPVPQGATLHHLRHSYGSLLVRHRESIKAVQARLGHSKPSITLDVYVHEFEEVEDTTREAVQEALDGIAC